MPRYWLWNAQPVHCVDPEARINFQGVKPIKAVLHIDVDPWQPVPFGYGCITNIKVNGQTVYDAGAFKMCDQVDVDITPYIGPHENVITPCFYVAWGVCNLVAQSSITGYIDAEFPPGVTPPTPTPPPPPGGTTEQILEQLRRFAPIIVLVVGGVILIKLLK